MESTNTFINAILRLSPHLSAPAKKSLSALERILECFPGEPLPQIEKNILALVNLRDCFPGQSLSDVEKNIKKLIKESRARPLGISERAKLFCDGAFSESSEEILKDFTKLNAADGTKVGKLLGFELSGSKSEICEGFQNWLESRGKDVPLTAKERDLECAKKYALDIAHLRNNVTEDNISQVISSVTNAYDNLKLPGFKAFASELGIPVDGTKAAMKKQLANYFKRMAVTHSQTHV